MSDLRGYPVTFLRCRAWGHLWETKGAFKERTSSGAQHIVQRWHCDCGTVATDHFTASFQRYGHRAYDYPDNYRPVPDRLDARKEWFRRFPPGRASRKGVARDLRDAAAVAVRPDHRQPGG